MIVPRALAREGAISTAYARARLENLDHMVERALRHYALRPASPVDLDGTCRSGAVILCRLNDNGQ